MRKLFSFGININRRLMLTTIMVFSILMSIGGIATQGNQVSAASNQSLGIVYLTDTQFIANFVKVFGPEAANVHRVKQTFALNTNNGYKFDTLTPVQRQMGNWSGYSLDNSTGTTIYGVMGQFNAKKTTSGAVDGAWVGISGLQSTDNLLQVGIDMDPNYFKPFWEYYPGDINFIDIAVGVGDDIHVSVGHDYLNYWFIAFWDQTTQYGWGEDEYFAPTKNCADWILETPHGYHMGSYGTVNFQICRWWDGAQITHNMNYAGSGTLYQCIITDDYGEHNTVSGISLDSNNYTEFSITKN